MSNNSDITIFELALEKIKAFTNHRIDLLPSDRINIEDLKIKGTIINEDILFRIFKDA
jgi:hypothetical protein